MMEYQQYQTTIVENYLLVAKLAYCSAASAGILKNYKSIFQSYVMKNELITNLEQTLSEIDTELYSKRKAERLKLKKCFSALFKNELVEYSILDKPETKSKVTETPVEIIDYANLRLNKAKTYARLSLREGVEICIGLNNRGNNTLVTDSEPGYILHVKNEPGAIVTISPDADMSELMIAVNLAFIRSKAFKVHANIRGLVSIAFAENVYSRSLNGRYIFHFRKIWKELIGTNTCFSILKRVISFEPTGEYTFLYRSNEATRTIDPLKKICNYSKIK